MNVKEIPIDQIVTEIDYETALLNDRKRIESIAEEISATGSMEPITVKMISDNKYELLVGVGRFFAMRTLGKSTISSWVIDR